MNRPLWKEKSLVEQDDRTQQGLPFVFLLVTFRSIWRKWQRSCCIHFLLVVWVEWLKCGVPLDGEAIRVRHCLCIWFSDQYVGPNGDSHSTFILERELFRDVVPDKKKKSWVLNSWKVPDGQWSWAFLQKRQRGWKDMLQNYDLGSMLGTMKFWIVFTLLEAPGAGWDQRSAFRVNDCSLALPTKVWSGSRETNGGGQSLQHLVSVLLP